MEKKEEAFAEEVDWASQVESARLIRTFIAAHLKARSKIARLSLRAPRKQSAPVAARAMRRVLFPPRTARAAPNLRVHKT